jgi:carbon monoxide dehydrogenase subunit G
MEMTGEQLIPQTQDVTWKALNDTEVLKDCIPGCESIVQTADNQYELVMTARVGPVSAKFKGKMTLADVVAPQSYRLVFEGQGGVAGFAKGEAQVRLDPQDNKTQLTYNVNAMIGGKLAQIGSRLIDGVAKKIAGDFFSKFNTRVSKGQA